MESTTKDVQRAGGVNKLKTAVRKQQLIKEVQRVGENMSKSKFCDSTFL